MSFLMAGVPYRRDFRVELDAVGRRWLTRGGALVREEADALELERVAGALGCQDLALGDDRDDRDADRFASEIWRVRVRASVTMTVLKWQGPLLH
jgi:hypothetical protein